MKYLRTYEIYTIPDNLPEKNDYVVIKNEFLDKLPFLKNKIGKIVNVNIWNSGGKYEKTEFRIYFDVKEKNNMNGQSIWTFVKNAILGFSKNEKDLEIYLNANKYNL